MKNLFSPERGKHSLQHILNLSFLQLQKTLSKLKLPKFTAKQIWEWIYVKHIFDFDLMSNISVANRQILKQNLQISLPKIEQELTSLDNQAHKYIFKLEDNHLIESVVIREKEYDTLCISSQVGCPADCKFCVTGSLGFKRNLTTAEIIGQILQVIAQGKTISNIVFMGMGEPLLNYNSVLQAIDIITSEQALNISQRKITVSTIGIINSLKQLIAEKRVLNLAWSIGSPDPLKRVIIMPIERKNSIIELARLFNEYQKLHNRKLTLEYTLLKNQNDSQEELKELANLAIYLNAKVNLIKFNNYPNSKFLPLDKTQMLDIKNFLQQQKINVTIRNSKGSDIGAACGLLGK